MFIRMKKNAMQCCKRDKQALSFTFSGSVNQYNLSSNFQICIKSHKKIYIFLPRNSMSRDFEKTIRKVYKKIQRCLFKSLKKLKWPKCPPIGFFSKLFCTNIKMLSCHKINKIDLFIQQRFTELLPSVKHYSRYKG